MTTHDSAPMCEETPHGTQKTQPAEYNHERSGNKLDLLGDLICREGDEPETKSAALVVLMSMIESSTRPTALVNRAKHLAFAHYDDVNVDDMIDAQIATIEAELFAATHLFLDGA